MNILPDFDDTSPDQRETFSFNFGPNPIGGSRGLLPLGTSLVGPPQAFALVAEVRKGDGDNDADATARISNAQISPLSPQVVTFQWGPGNVDGTYYILGVKVQTSDNQIVEAWSHIMCTAPK